jgi:hypothetical protein
VAVFVSWGGQLNVPQTRQLKQQKRILSRFSSWKSEIQASAGFVLSEGCERRAYSRPFSMVYLHGIHVCVRVQIYPFSNNALITDRSLPYSSIISF